MYIANYIIENNTMVRQTAKNYFSFHEVRNSKKGMRFVVECGNIKIKGVIHGPYCLVP